MSVWVPDSRLRVAVATVAVVAGGLIVSATTRLAVERVGILAIALPLAAAGCWWLALRPAAAIAAPVIAVIVFESDHQGFMVATVLWYRSVGPLPLTPTDVLLGVAVVSVLIDRSMRGRALRLPGPFTLPLILLVLASAAGVVTGRAAGASTIDLMNGVRILSYLVVVPMLVVQQLQNRRAVRWVVRVVAVIAVVKGGVGLLGWSLGRGRHVGESLLTYYAPTPNLVMMLLLLGLLAAAVTRYPVPRRMWLWSALPATAFVLSYRRSFWVAFVVGAVAVAIVGTGARGRLVLLASSALLVGSVWYVFNANDSPEQRDNAFVERVRSFDPEEIEQSADDRYRLDEQRNVREELRRAPLVGLGLGVPWQARLPLSIENPGGRQYTHMTVLWYWLKLGLLGLAAYVVLLLTALRCSYRLWRESSDPLVRVASLAVGASFIGLALAETTGSFTGVEGRVTVFVGALYGWLAAALANQDATATDEAMAVAAVR